MSQELGIILDNSLCGLIINKVYGLEYGRKEAEWKKNH